MNEPKRRDSAFNPGMQMREKAMSIAMKRKEEYLGARVPKALKERVIKKADEMGIPVSLLIRRILEEAFSENPGSSAVASTDSAISEKPKQELFSNVIGWKNMEVNLDRSCERCREPLPKGTVAELGFTSSNTGYVIVCHQCKTQLANT